MKISKEFKKIREENTPDYMYITYTPCTNCVYSIKLNYECQRCGKCGRVFNSKGVLVKESNGKLVYSDKG